MGEQFKITLGQRLPNLVVISYFSLTFHLFHVNVLDPRTDNYPVWSLPIDYYSLPDTLLMPAALDLSHRSSSLDQFIDTGQLKQSSAERVTR